MGVKGLAATLVGWESCGYLFLADSTKQAQLFAGAVFAPYIEGGARGNGSIQVTLQRLAVLRQIAGTEGRLRCDLR